jgi:hypothetical protein
MTQVVYSGSDRALRTREIKQRDIAIPFPHKGAIGTGTNDLPDVVDARDNRAVIVGLITGTANLDRFFFLLTKKPSPAKLLPTISPFLLMSVNRTISSRDCPRNVNSSGTSTIVNLYPALAPWLTPGRAENDKKPLKSIPSIAVFFICASLIAGAYWRNLSLLVNCFLFLAFTCLNTLGWHLSVYRV